MKKKPVLGAALSGAAAGTVNGLFGAGGGMVLVPLLTYLTDLKDEEVFPASVSVILPICLVSLLTSFQKGVLDWGAALPYLIGSAAGGVLAGLFGRRVPAVWLHRILGVLILWGGIRNLC